MRFTQVPSEPCREFDQRHCHAVSRVFLSFAHTRVRMERHKWTDRVSSRDTFQGDAYVVALSVTILASLGHPKGREGSA
jgi:hypothetical protein